MLVVGKAGLGDAVDGRPPDFEQAPRRLPVPWHGLPRARACVGLRGVAGEDMGVNGYCDVFKIESKQANSITVCSSNQSHSVACKLVSSMEA
mgnify:CR=1 FL=1